MRPSFVSLASRHLASFTAVLCLLMLGFSQSTASAQTYLFDFGAGANTTQNGPAPEDPVNFWNNVTDAIGNSPTAVLTNIVTAANAPSTLGFAMISRFNGANGSGTTAASQFPVEATRDSLFGNTEGFSGQTNIFPSFKLTGLNPAALYDLTFYASRTGVSDNREAGYTVVGANNGFAALNAANNVTNVTNVSGIFPTAAGEITISIAPTANNNNTMHFTYLGVLKVVGVPPQTPIGFTVEPANTRAVELSPVTFTSAVTGSAPYFIQWFSNGVPITGANQFNYTIASPVLNMDGSVFSVNVSNLAYSITSSNATLRVVNDTNPPVLLSVSTMDGLTFTLCFDEALTVDSAEEELNYLFNEGHLDTFPATAVRSLDGRCVTLTLEEKLVGTFTLTLWYLIDLSGNQIPFGTTNIGEVPSAEGQMVLIDFGGASTTDHASGPADDPNRYWNNIPLSTAQTDGGQVSGLVTTQNLVSAIGLTFVSRFNAANENGTTDPTASFPTDATKDSLYGNTETFNGLANIFPSLKLTGLSLTQAYTLTFYASRTGVTDVRETQYTVTGSATSTAFLDVANNVTNKAIVSGVQPNASGEILISLAPGPNNNNANHFTYLGVLAITPGAPVVKFLSPTVIGGSISLQWTGSGQLQWGPTVTGLWSTITPAVPNVHSEPVDLTTNRFFRLAP